MNANEHRSRPPARRGWLICIAGGATAAALGLAGAGGPAHASAGTPGASATASKARRLVQVTPVSGSENVDPSLKMMEIRFDRPMEPGYSVVGTQADSPEMGEPRWNRDRTVLQIPVRLAPGKQYKMSLNGGRFHNFRSAEGEPLVPVPWTFSTAQGKSTR